MADKMIGKLTIDISDVEKKLAQVNTALAKVGAGVKVDLSKDIGKEVKAQLDGVLKEIQGYEAKMSAAVDNAISNATERTQKKVDSNELKEAIALWKEYYSLMTKAQRAENSGHSNQASYWRTEAEAIKEKASALRDEAQLEKELAKVKQSYSAALEARKDKEAADAKRDLARTLQEEARHYREVAKEKEQAQKTQAQEAARAEKEALDEEAGALETLIRLYVKKQELDRQATNAIASGKMDVANGYLNREQDIDRLINKVRALYPELDKWAKMDERVTEAEFKRSQAMVDAQEKAQKQSTKEQLEQEKKTLIDLIDLYVRKAQAEASLNEATYKNNGANKQLFEGRVAEINAQIDAIARLNPELNTLAQANDRVVDAVMRRDEAENRLRVSAGDADLKERTQAISQYAAKMSEYFNEIAKLNQQMATGKIVEGSNEYIAYTNNIQRLKGEVQELGKNLDQAGREAAAASTNVQNAVANMSKASAAMSDNQYLTDMRQKYFDLTQAIKDYNAARKSKDSAGMDSAMASINAIMSEVALIKQAVENTEMESNAKQQVLNLIKQCETAQRGANASTLQTTTDLQSAVNGLVTRYLSLLAVIRMIKNVLSEMVEYVSAYSDKMNEIRIITGKTQEEANRLGETYRGLAESMSVSSLDMADAAIYFTRQGLSAADIEKRLKSTTMYAKTANIEFERAAELITAVVNSMGLVEQEAEDGRTAAQRVADVFLKVGDNAATSGEEIGEAMQKAAASAGTFGVSFEWLAAYIATVSETTRQEARTIGTAFNTIIARLHQIKQTGYNSEDETKINDIAKALSNIDVALMDQNGEWRDMTDIFEDVAGKWNELDDKTRSYIATTMAGVKQQNVFLALMNDMAKGTENGSRAFELYGKAIDSAGTAEEKYATYTDSVTAAQERLTVAQEKFYALLHSDTLKWWYEALTNVVNGITRATQATHGINIALPVLIGLITALSIAFHKAAASGVAAGAAFKTFAASHPVVLGVLAMAAAFSALSGAASAATASTEDAQSRYAAAAQEFQQAAQHLKDDASTQKQFNEMMAQFQKDGALSNDELTKYNSLLDELSTISPVARETVEQLRDGVIEQADAFRILNGEMERTVENDRKAAARKLIKQLAAPGNGVPSDEFSPENLEYYKRIAAHEDWFVGNDANEKMINAMRRAYQEAQDMVDEAVSWGDDLWEKAKLGVGGLLKDVGLSNDYYIPDHFEGRQNLLPAEMFLQMYPNMSDEKIMELWRRYFGDVMLGDDPTEQLRAELEKTVNGIINGVFADLDSYDQGVLRDYLLRAVMGDDMEITADEYDAAGDKLSEIIMRLIENGFSVADIDPSYMLKIIGEKLIGEGFGDVFAKDIANIASQPDVIRQISDAYAALIEAGLSEDMLSRVYEDIMSQYGIEGWINAVDEVKSQLRGKISQGYGSDSNGSLIEGLFGNDFATLDLQMLKLLSDLQDAGATFEEIQSIVISSSSDDDLIARLTKLLNMKINPEVPKEINDIVKELKEAEKEIGNFDKVLDKITKGEKVGFSDLLDLAEAHPQLMAMINDMGALRAEIEYLKSQKAQTIIDNLREGLMTSEDVMAFSPFHSMMNDNVRTLADLGESLDVERYVNQTIAMFMSATGQLESVGNYWMETFINSAFDNANMDLLHRKVLDAADLVKAGWTEAGEGFDAMFAQTIAAGNKGNGAELEWNRDVVISMTPVLPDSTVLTPEEAKKYLDGLLQNSMDEEDLLTYDKVENGGKGILIDVTAVADDESFDGASERIRGLLDVLRELHSYMFDNPEGEEKSWLEKQVEAANAQADLDWAKSNNYTEQIGAIENALASGGIDAAYEKWNQYDETMRKSISETYPELARAMLEVEQAVKDTEDGVHDADKAQRDLNSTLQKSMKLATAKNFTNTYQAIQKLEKGTISATDAYETFNKELDEVVKAGEDITDVEEKITEQTEVTANDVSNLSKVLGIPAETILQDWPSAVSAFDQLTGAAGELKNVFDMLNEAAFIRITGQSEADFSQLENGLHAIQADAQDVIDLLVATGQWEVETTDLPQEGKMWDPLTKAWKTFKTSAEATFLKPTGKNPYAGRGGGVNKDAKAGKSGGGGGGGGGGDKSNANSMTEVERMLDRMNQMQAIQEYQQSYYQAQKGYYEQQGQLQGVIAYNQKEIDLLKEQGDTLRENIKDIEYWMDLKRDELASLSTSDEKYEEVSGDLDQLQQAHQKYTIALINSDKAINELTEDIEEQRKKIRDMEISLRQTVMKAIEDREKRTEKMLNAEIDMENKVLDLITKRYEKERDQIIDTTNMKIDSLRKESDLLEEQLRLRKEHSELEDKEKKLAEYELQYQRIMADPTRRKEAMEIDTKIRDLREEMAWDAAEKEVEAQKESIEQQVVSLEDYIQYVEDYYEDLFNHPQKLIEEMKEVLEHTDEEIINWLIENDEEFAKSTENTQAKMVSDWQNTLDEMHDVIKTYWDEVEEIILRGDDGIIEFLKENSDDYRTAGKLQAEAYVDEWKKQLDDLKEAYKAVAAEAASSYKVIEKGEGGSSKSGGGGGGGGGSGSSKTSSKTFDKYVYFDASDTIHKKHKQYTDGTLEFVKNEDHVFGPDGICKYCDHDKASSSTATGASSSGKKGNMAGKNLNNTTLMKYASGGLATTTGPAWIDGTPTMPERVLSPYQTQLFETMVNALDNINRISIGGMSNMNGIQMTGGAPLSVGDIIVNVDNLDTDDDYNTLAQKVMGVIMERIGRTSVVGGLRISPV